MSSSTNVDDSEDQRLAYEFCKEFVKNFEGKLDKHKASLKLEKGTSRAANLIGGVAGNVVSILCNIFRLSR